MIHSLGVRVDLKTRYWELIRLLFDSAQVAILYLQLWRRQ